jgi:CheY-like chemotaxis protein
MEGDVTCKSSPGQGSVFTLSVFLPLPAEGAATAAKMPDVDLHSLAGLRVLVAEDNLINQMIIEEVLNAANIDVTIAENGLEALKALEKAPFDLVLMDIQMPEMDGLTATAQIRADRRYDKMPILAMTAHSAAEHREESLRAGMNDHLTKPIDVDGIYLALKRWDPRGLK